MEKLRITLLQSDLVWEDPSENIKAFTLKLNRLKKASDIVVLPEMFTTGFSLNSKELSEKMTGKSVTWMRNKAKKIDALILGSLIIEEEGFYFNRLIAAFPNGDFKYYDKHHLFTLSGEDKFYTAGQERLQFNFKGWHICPLICYDLRFPVWSRNTTNCDVLIYIASWPKPRIDAWDTLLKARAIENMTYVVGVNRVGIDGNQLEYCGHSAAYDCLGKKLTPDNENQETIIYEALDKNYLLTNRKKLNFLNDRDTFEIN
ncbi:MAG: amidohydrolase [Flavobacteriaceae bacterium]|nr:amidohydrolase [Flavobacteriaceae bacterium]